MTTMSYELPAKVSLTVCETICLGRWVLPSRAALHAQSAQLRILF